ncbi:hypothetical protein NQ315_005508 [Exocentrus adspersus]|uniref:Uncharacterized protein n=1 Tax=Exocentrus adspersus TaxID=1586481 RepID=A0AAV8VSV5_9CUCU|nr:hypothetical protein NQ315_005508 [Exocentrus adspersus]
MTNPSHQKLEMDIDYPDNVNNERHENRTMERNFPAVTSKPPISRLRKSPEASSSSANSLTRQSNSQTSLIYNDNKRLSQASPASENLENSYGRYRRSQVSPVVDNQERITTNAMVHVNANNIRSATPNNLLHNRSLSPVTPQSIRSSTPVEFRLSPSAKSSPQKEDMRKSVEAYYWKELKKLKEQENFDMYLYQLQMMPYGYAEDPISVRRSRSLSPTSHRNSRRSLSLPRDPRPHNLPQDIPEMYGRIQPAPIPEGRAVVNQPPQRNVMYGQLQQYQPNFRRNTPERRTIDGAPRIVDNNYRPIFKRGSLTTPVKELEDAQNKKVSFSSSDSQKLQSWPTRNGFTQSPPQRRVDSTRISSVEDDVFLPNTPRTPNRYEVNEIYGYVNKPNVWYDYGPNPNEVVYYTRQNVEVKNSEPLYDRNPNNVRYVVNYPIEESAYGQPVDAVVRPPYRLTRHGSIQLPEPVYDQRQINSRRRSFENGQVRPVPEPQYVTRQAVPPQNQVNMRYGIKREIILNDEIFGQFGGYVQPGTLQNRQNPVYSSKQSIAEPLYGRTGPKQVSVRNKVCDIYGQIHDPAGTPTVGTPTQIRRTGVLMGQLQTSPGSPQPLRQPLTNDQFLRNTRLTASANDMYRRYQNVDPRYRSDVVYDGTRYQQQQQETVAPNRPLPPVPMKKGLTRNHTARSDTDSDASEMHKVNNSGAKNKKRGFFGK